MTGNLTARLKRVQERLANRPRDVASELKATALAKYLRDPSGYARDILHGSPTQQQDEIANLLLVYPYRVKVPSGHNVGKTFMAAWLVNWWYDTRDPSVVITTAPTQRDVVDLLWTEIRLQRQRAGLPMQFVGPRAPEMRTSEEHYAKGYTARLGQSFQGRHRANMLFVFDEDEGVDAPYWITAETMFQADGTHGFLCIGNPTTNTSRSALEEMATDKQGNPKWRIRRLSALDHPNIKKQLDGEPPGIPSAVTLEQVDQWVTDWCEPVPAGEQQVTDIEWRPETGQWFRPGPIAEARILGRRPSTGTSGVWPPALWDAVEELSLPIDWHLLPEIGCDVARYGDDWTSIHVRIGAVSVHHETHNGWSVTRIAARLKELAYEWAGDVTAHRDPQAARIDARLVRIKVDDDGVGGGVIDTLRTWGFSVVAVSAGTTAAKPLFYSNKRSELWFQTVEKARVGQVSLARLDRPTRARMRTQATAPEWAPDAAGRRVVERKEDTKEKIARSPDDLDALNLAFYDAAHETASALTVGEDEKRARRARFGR